MGTGQRPGAAHCGIDAAIEVIGGKWKVLVVWALEVQGRVRFGQLRRMIPGVTEKVLAAQLRELEAAGIVRREVFDEVPPRVEYSLTPRGRELSDALAPLGEWGWKHFVPDAAGGPEPA
ncbi:winged helix-turn-helix transcriptional regulator [Embleya sp. NPDC001921]